MPRTLGGTRGIERRESGGRARQSHTGIPRTPRTAWIPETPGEKPPSYSCSSFFVRNLAKSSCKKEKARREPL